MLQRRLLSLSIVAGLIAALALILTAPAALAGGNGVVESVTGSSHMTVPLSEFDPDLEGEAVMRTLSYNAKRKADGTVSGQYQYHLEVFGRSDNVHGSIICFKAEGNRAWIGATVDQTNNPNLEGLYSWWQVEDNGQGSNSPADRTTFLGFGSLQATLDYCEGPDPNFIFDIDGGNIKVRAAD